METYPGESLYAELLVRFGYDDDSFLLPKLFRYTGSHWEPVL